ncbi:MAG: SDR family oxidoreductase [Myxococcota bacterium]
MGTYVVTGANRGIGLELCRRLSQRGDQVIAVCRRSVPALEELGCRVESEVDVTDPETIRQLRTRLGEGSVDVLINNAGILESDSLPALDPRSLRRQFEVNALGPLLTTQILLDRFARPAKVAIITSRMGSMTDNTSGGMYGYRMSKAAVNAAGRSLAHDLAHCDVAVGLFHPGFVSTEMTGGRGDVDPSTSAARLIERIDEMTVANAGRFIHANGQVLDW